MKDKLTPEQSQHLIELGVAPSRASMCQIQHSADGETIYSIVEHDEFCYEMSCLHPKPIFDLSDILSLLPKRIDDLILSIFGTMVDELAKAAKEGWMVSYVDEHVEAESTDTIFQAPELIDALYELLCWVLQNHPDKIKTLKR